MSANYNTPSSRNQQANTTHKTLAARLSQKGITPQSVCVGEGKFYDNLKHGSQMTDRLGRSPIFVIRGDR